MSKIKKVLVTGAAGFIGSHLVEKLLEKKFKVKAFVRYNSSSNINWLNQINHKNKNLKIIFGDITDPDSITEAVSGCDAVINLAAMISVPYSLKYPQSFIDINVNGLLNLFRACKMKKNRIKKIIQISSSEVYGNVLNNGKKYLEEKDILSAESPYAASKIAADQLSLSMFKEYGLPVVVARPFNTFGPRQSTRAVIPTIITQAIKSNKIKMGNINTSRDFLYVKDNVDALTKLLISQNTNGQVFNISTQNSVKIKDVIQILENHLSSKFTITTNFSRLRTSEVFKLIGSNKKINKKINWKPNYSGKSGFKRALIETYDWFNEQKNLNMYKNISRYHI